MISPETRVQIRRYFYAEHWKIGTIAQAIGGKRGIAALAFVPAFIVYMNRFQIQPEETRAILTLP
jgi:hypothetical protein